MRFIRHSLILFTFAALGTAQASLTAFSLEANKTAHLAKSPAPGPVLNSLCKAAILERVEFFGVDGIENYVNFCEVEPTLVPEDVSSVIQKMGELNSRVASVLGVRKELLFSMGVSVSFRASESGALGESQGNREGVALAVLPTWKFAHFSSMLYTHEVIHVLNFNPGPFADMMVGLEDHPYLFEALPDLISAVVHRSPKITIADPDLPECLRDFRDGTPIQSLGAPFSHFYPLGSVDGVIACCESSKALGSQAKEICRTYKEVRPKSLAEIRFLRENQHLEFREHTPKELAEPFRAIHCVVKTPSGLSLLDNCDSHQFSQSLISFFFRLKELTGRWQLLPFMKQIKAQAPRAASYLCGYPTGNKAFGGTRAKVRIRPLLGAFIALRESLPGAAQSQFDLAWSEHEMDKFVDLDRLYRLDTFSGLAQVRVGAQNPAFRKQNGCDNLYNFDPKHCGVVCERADGPDLD